MVLTALRRLGEGSKAELARLVNLTQNATGQIVRELEQQGLVCTVGKRVGQRGQPATLLRLNPQGAYAIGVKLGRRWLDSMLVDFTGRVIKSRRHEAPFPLPEQALAIMRADIAALRRLLAPRERSRLAGVGLAMPYNLGSWRWELDIPPEASAAWNDFDLAARLRAELDMPVVVENDGTAVAVAELFRGHGRELDDFVVVFLGTALGGGIVLGGNYRRGVSGNAGDLGLMPVPASRLATAPKPNHEFDLLLTRASVSSLIRHLRGNGAVIRSGEELDRAIESRPALVDEWLEDCADALVNPLLATASLLDVEAIVIDGNLPRELVARLLTRLRSLLAAAVPEAREAPVLRLGMIGRDAAAIGAAILPLHLGYGPVRAAAEDATPAFVD